MNQCENFGAYPIPDLCKILDQKNKIWSDTVEHTQPKAKCPFNTTSIKVINATVNLAYIAHIPFLSDYAWVFYFKAFKPINKMRYKKRLIFCYIAEATITRAVKEKRKI